MLKKTLKIYKPIIVYSFFGVLTTIINTITYIVLFNILQMANIPSNFIAWVFAVAFAFITNKIWVFESRDFSPVVIKRECIKFTGCRIGTGLLDMIIMFVGVDVMGGNSLVYKIISNIIVIVCNYIASKLVVFKK